MVSRRELGRVSGGTGGGPPVSQAAAAEAAAAFYAGAELIAEPPPARSLIPASGLRCPEGEGRDRAGEEDDLSRLLKKAGLGPADFGALVHGFVEARFSGGKPALRLLAGLDEKNAALIEAAAQEMGDRFFASALGQRSLRAAYRETEFPVITGATLGDRTFTITGQIDLLFEWDGAIQVVDFKTDRTEEADRHRGQRAVYARAAGDIFGKPVRAWLFFFRTGREVELTAGIREGDIEKMLMEQLLHEQPLHEQL